MANFKIKVYLESSESDSSVCSHIGAGECLIGWAGTELVFNNACSLAIKISKNTYI